MKANTLCIRCGFPRKSHKLRVWKAKGYCLMSFISFPDGIITMKFCTGFKETK